MTNNFKLAIKKKNATIVQNSAGPKKSGQLCQLIKFLLIQIFGNPANEGHIGRGTNDVIKPF